MNTNITELREFDFNKTEALIEWLGFDTVSNMECFDLDDYYLYLNCATDEQLGNYIIKESGLYEPEEVEYLDASKIADKFINSNDGEYTTKGFIVKFD